VRTLSAELLAAQKDTARVPYVTVVTENSVRGLRRLAQQTYIGTNQTLADHGVAAPGDDSFTRVRSDGAGGILTNRITNVATGWNAWTSRATGKGNIVGIAARAARVAIVYTDAAGTGLKLIESTDYGATYGSETAITTAGAAATHIKVAYKNDSGDLAVAWLQGDTNIRIIRRTSGSFGSVSASGAVAATLTGLALVYGFDWDIAATGTETTTLKPTLWTIVFGDGNDVTAGNWGSIQIQQQADVAASVAFSRPFLAYADTYALTYIEADTFTGGNTRAYIARLNPAQNYNAGAYTWPAGSPLDYSGAYGVAIAYDASFYGDAFLWATANDYETSFPYTQLLGDYTARVLALDIHETPTGTRGTIDLDNADGALNDTQSDTALALQLGNLCAVSFGYYTTSGDQASRMADLWIRAVEHVRDGSLSVVRLHLADLWWLLEHTRARAQIVHTADTYSTILARALARAGIHLTLSAASTRLTTVTPQATIPTTETVAQTVRRLLAFVADRIRSRPAAAAQCTEPLASAATQYTFDATHAIGNAHHVVSAERVTWLHALGAGAFGEAIDYANQALQLGAIDQQRDISSSTGAAAAATATAALRQRELDTPAGTLEVRPHCGLELLDVIDYSDASISSAALKYRVRGIRWRFARRPRALYTQTLELGVV
jgi:hypothetical protein